MFSRPKEDVSTAAADVVTEAAAKDPEIDTVLATAVAGAMVEADAVSKTPKKQPDLPDGWRWTGSGSVNPIGKKRYDTPYTRESQWNGPLESWDEAEAAMRDAYPIEEGYKVERLWKPE